MNSKALRLKLLAIAFIGNSVIYFILSEKKSCVTQQPSERKVFIHNMIWQVVETSKGILFLLNAYIDDRENKTIIRVNVNGIELNLTSDVIFCHLWFNGSSEAKTVRATEIILMWDEDYKGLMKGSSNHPYLISCPLNDLKSLPASVSLTTSACSRAENNLKIISPAYNVKQKFGVCTSFINFESRDYGVRLIEWIHMLQLLGASKIQIYNRFVHSDVYKVLKYFEDVGMVELKQFFEPRNFELHTSEAVAFQLNVLNDCFYRQRNKYEYIVVLDTDEIIMPVNEADKTWGDLINRILKEVEGFEHVDSFSAENFYFP